MADLWYPKATRDPGNSAGDYTDLGEPKGLLHTTEGKTYASARSAFVANNSWPHATCSYETGQFQIWQHNPINVASRALRNLSGGVETNRDNVVQLEIVGTADRGNASSWGNQYVENFPDGYLDGIGDWMAWVNENRDVPNRCTLTFKTYPESYGDNGVRLTGAQWDAYTGWLGHMHAPENVHGDPGLIDIRYLLNRAGGTDLTPEENQELFRIGDRLQRVEDGLKDATTGYVSDAFTESGTGTRTAIAGSADGSTTGLFDIGWDRSKKRRYMESKIDKLLEHFGITPPSPPT